MVKAVDPDELGEDLNGDDDADKKSAERINSSPAYFQAAACCNISWFHPERNEWLRWQTDIASWSGWTADASVANCAGLSWEPWEQILDESEPPFYRWFCGAQTNAAFNEVDLHVLEGHGDQLAYIEEADPMVEGDVGNQITRGDLLAKSAAAAACLKCDFGLVTGDRILIFMPAGIEQIVWVEACKRMGVIYCCCNPNLPAEQIADRVCVLQAKVVITVDHPEWSFVVHNAVNNFVPVPDAIDKAINVIGAAREKVEKQWMNRFTVSLKEPPFTCIDVCDGVLLNVKVLIVGTQVLPVNPLLAKLKKPVVKADTRVISELQAPAAPVKGPEGVAVIWDQFGAPVPVEANFPLFVIFTSGTTGKPKGVAHAHAYIAGLVETMKVVFNADPDADRMLTVGALGWITGQSYQICAVLALRITSVLMRGNPVKPACSRFAEVINKHKITIFKAGSAFLREVMSTSKDMEEVKLQSLKHSLRIGTFCAEPVSEAVHEFAQQHICDNYINSYWATEHGGIAWSRQYRNPQQPLKPDAHSWPLPWVNADIFVYDESSRPSEAVGTWKARPANFGERADVVCTAPYPYMFRYVWGDVDNFGKPGWTGDRSVMMTKYWRRTQLPDQTELWAYTQGDFAVKYEDGSYTFHGRSDEVLNVNGILFGTEHIEGAILRDKQLNPDSVVGHCVVVGYPDRVAGEVPMAFLVPSDPSRKVSIVDTMKLYKLVEQTVGSVSIKFVPVSTLPQTFSGKFMRRVLKSIALEEPLGDLSSISNPDCIRQLKHEFSMWKKMPG